MANDLFKGLGGFDVTPRKDSFAARVARANDVNANPDTAELTDNEKTALRKASDIEKAAENFKFVPVEQAIEKVEIIFDNSGSMSGDKIVNAKEGVTEFMKSCKPNETAVRISPINDESLTMTTNLPVLADQLKNLHAKGGTPLYSTINRALNRREYRATRLIAFSDGEADEWARTTKNEYRNGMESEGHRQTVKAAKEAGIVIDTCYIANGEGWNEEQAEQTMQRLAEDTGGIFLKFEKGKCDFRRGFKYLTKGNRLFLMDNNFKAKLEAGEIGK